MTRDHSIAICPVIDTINDDTFEYHYGDAKATSIGGFGWNLQVIITIILIIHLKQLKIANMQKLNQGFHQFSWHAIPQREKDRRSHPAEPVYSPVRQM